MKILLTNDDGIDAPGLAALEEACRELGDVIVVAPESAHSGCSHRTTTDRPLIARPRGSKRFAINGAPADCVRIGLLQLAPDAEIVFAGINDGGNLGVDIFMSGTVAAAREAVLLGRPAVALSHYRRRSAAIDWERASRATTRVLDELPWSDRTRNGYWNVNFPHASDADAAPEIVHCEPDPSPLPVTFELRDDAYHYTGDYAARPRQAEADVDVCFSGRIAVSFVALRVL